MGSNFLHRSLDQGDQFEKISPDLTSGGIKGDVPYGTLTSIHESPLRFGLLYTGSDDGLVHCSKDGGHSWQDISAGLPEKMWVSRVSGQCPPGGRCLCSPQWDTDGTIGESHLYRSMDYGAKWTRIGTTLPTEPVNVVREDPENPQILYVGTDHGAYVSFDTGQTFYGFSEGLPAVAVHDIVIHPRNKDILIGTHGRSLFLGPAAQLQLLTTTLLMDDLYVFELEDGRSRSNWGRQSWYGTEEPEMTIPIYASAPGAASISVSIKDGPELKNYSTDLARGLNYVPYDYSISEEILNEYQKTINERTEEDQLPPVIKAADNGVIYLRAGDYVVTVRKGEAKVTQHFSLSD